MRAVAHPVRVGLLELLYQRGPLTASACALLLELSPKVCSYRLTLLGKYGLAEETGEGKGRARPWRLAMTEVSYVHRPDEPVAAADAADEYARTMLARQTRIIEVFIARRRRLPTAWRNVATISETSLQLTAGQLRKLGDELRAVTARYEQESKPSSAGTRAVHAVLYAVPIELPDLVR